MSQNSEATLLLRIKTAGENALSKIKGALTDIRTWAVAAFAALTSGVAISAFREAEEATNRLNQSLVNQGIYTKKLSGEYQDMAADLQKVTIYEDDAIKSAQAQMQSYLGQTKISKELMVATLNLATAKKMDLAAAAEMVGKSIGTGTNALARQGVELDTTASKSDKMAKVVDALNQRYAGFAEEQGRGLGALTIAKNAVGELAEAVGERLAPFVVAGAQAIARMANSVVENQNVWYFFQAVLQTLAQIISGLKMQVVVLGDVLVNTFQAIVSAVSKLAEGDFKGALKAITDGFDKTVTDVKTDFKNYKAELAQIDQVYTDREKQKQDEDIKRTKDAEGKKGQAKMATAAEIEAFLKTMDDKEMDRLRLYDRLKNNNHIIALNHQIENEKDYTRKLELEKKKRGIIDAEEAKMRSENATNVEKIQAFLADKRVQAFSHTMDDLSQLQNSKSKVMVGIGKGAALAQIAINTAQAATGAYAAMSNIPVVGPTVLGPGAAAAVIAYGAERSANVLGIQLAEGGIVKATPGGVHAIIGEGGRDEAVIPLDNTGSPMLGTNIHLTVHGGMLGDRQQAREFGRAIDVELFRLRQSNESLAFDRGIT